MAALTFSPSTIFTKYSTIYIYQLMTAKGA